MFNFKSKKVRAAGVVLGLAIGAVTLGACNSSAPVAVQKDQATSASILSQFETAQPTPQFKWSQYRQTLIEIETAEADGTQTTTFFFNQGVQNPVQSCPSIGFPIASTSELTNPVQDDNNGPNGNAGVAIGQIDPNGVYAGNSTGTYVLCVNADGSTYAAYWEGFTYTVSGPAVWDTTTNSVKLTGPSSQKFSVGKS